MFDLADEIVPIGCTAPEEAAYDEAPEGVIGKVELLGRGRSGSVYRLENADGRAIARKVFGSDGLTKLVQVLFLGTANPYAWNQDAIRCALLRRQVLTTLVRLWFGDRVRVANGLDTGGDEGGCWMDTELVDGHHVRLVGPMDSSGGDQYRELVRELMPALRARMRRAGLDGMLWQAGLGNPVALGNFMRDQHGRWWCIDLESGVPALFGWSPRALFGFYLPRSWRHRGWLFDDIDIPKLRAYLDEVDSELRQRLGDQQAEQLRTLVDGLAASQRAWKSPGRVERGVAWQLATGRIDATWAARYRRWPPLWYGRLALRAGAGVFRRLAGAPAGLWRLVSRVPFARATRELGAALVSHRRRVELGSRWVQFRVHSWASRRQLDAADAAALNEALEGDIASEYLADFGVHLALKPLVKTVEWWVLPALFAAGLISGPTLAASMILLGPAARSAYTLCRIAQRTAQRRPRPWTALFAGVFPVAGNFAFPLQILRSARDDQGAVARFLVLDGGVLAAKMVPIWGGRDTVTEHRLVRLAHWLVRLVSRGRRKTG